FLGVGGIGQLEVLERELLPEEGVVDLAEGALDAERLADALGGDPVDRGLRVEAAADGEADVEERDEDDHVGAEGPEQDEARLGRDGFLVLAGDEPLEGAEEL